MAFELSNVMMISVVDGCVAISGSQRKWQCETGLFLSQKKLPCHIYEGGRERKAPRESVLEVFCVFLSSVWIAARAGDGMSSAMD